MPATARTPPVERTVISVLVVDDSAVVRGLISRQVEAAGDMRVAGSASNGEMAVAEIKRRPVDIVVLDIEMPVMDGLTALPLLLAACPGVKVLIASSLTRANAEISLKALGLGASDYLAKPDSLVAAEEFNRDLLEKIRALAPLALPKASVTAPIGAPHRPTVSAATRPLVVAIGGSTGAPPVLMKLFEQMRGRVTQPILVTQHMPPTFTAILAEQLARAGARPCAEGVDGEPIVDGRAYIAPGGWHMTAARVDGRPVIRLNQDAQENYCRPAVDPMFRSLAQVYGPGVLAMVLTGMGADGATGCEAVAGAGGRVLVQDEASSAVWGMPGAAVRTGVVDKIIPLDGLAAALIQAAGAGA